MEGFDGSCFNKRMLRQARHGAPSRAAYGLLASAPSVLPGGGRALAGASLSILLASRASGFAICGSVLPLGALPGATLAPAPELVAASLGAALPAVVEVSLLASLSAVLDLAICDGVLPLGALPGAMLSASFAMVLLGVPLRVALLLPAPFSIVPVLRERLAG